MKANYENWMPKSLVNIFKYTYLLSATITTALIIYIFSLRMSGQHDPVWMALLGCILMIISFTLFIFFKKFRHMREVFDFENPKALSWKIINFTADKIKLAKGKKILDVGCGSGALSIAVAKRNRKSEVIGIDKWGISYKSFSKELCEKNALAEGITNVSFAQGNAVKLEFEDESFDGVVSNFVYHNIPGNKQNYLLETFRVLKKGGRFAIHDIFNKSGYGNMEKFLEELKAQGFEKVELLDTTAGKPLDYNEAKVTMLSGAKLLVGIK